MIQVYCDGEEGINKWLRGNQDIKIIDIQMALNNDGYGIMIVYEFGEENLKKEEIHELL